MQASRRHRFILSIALAGALLLVIRAMSPDRGSDEPPRFRVIPASSSPQVNAPPPAPEQPSEPAAAKPSSATGTLRGRVVDAVTREPIGEFELRMLETLDNKPLGRFVSKSFNVSDGRFEWRDVQAGNRFVTATAAGYQRFELPGLRIVAGAATPEIEMPLRAGFGLRGRVYDLLTGSGIPAATVSFREGHLGRYDGNWRNRVHVTTDKNGSFLLDGIPRGDVVLEVDAAGYAGRELRIHIDEEPLPLDIALSAGGMIAGRLTTADGQVPVAATVGLFNLDIGSGGTIPTGESGGFSFKQLSAGRYRLHGHAQGASVQRDIELARDEIQSGIELVLSKGRSIRGVVSGLLPDQLKRVSVWLRGADPTESFGSVSVDEQGAFELHSLSPGRVQIVADVASNRQLTKTVDVPADADVNVELVFPAGARMSGRVTRHGTPLAGVQLFPQSVVERDIFLYGTTSRKDGSYVLDGVPTGEYRIVVAAYQTRVVKVSGDTTFDIDIPKAQFTGHVFEDDGKQPIVDVNINLWPAQPHASAVRLYASSNHLGEFSVTGMEPGEFVMTAYKPGYAMFRERLSYSSPMSGVAIRLRRDAGIEIAARDADSGKPLGRLFLREVIGEGDGTLMQIPLDEDGKGQLPAALAGTSLSFGAPGYEFTAAREWDGQKIDLRLKRKQGP